MAVVALQQLPEAWIAKARELEPFAPPAAAAYRQAAEDLRAQLEAVEDGVTLHQAHEIGGYSVDHLGKLLASGVITNVGRKGRPRIRRQDVPIKPGHVALRTKTEPRQFRASAVVASALERDKR